MKMNINKTKRNMKNRWSINKETDPQVATMESMRTFTSMDGTASVISNFHIIGEYLNDNSREGSIKSIVASNVPTEHMTNNDVIIQRVINDTSDKSLSRTLFPKSKLHRPVSYLRDLFATNTDVTTIKEDETIPVYITDNTCNDRDNDIGIYVYQDDDDIIVDDGIEFQVRSQAEKTCQRDIDISIIPVSKMGLYSLGSFDVSEKYKRMPPHSSMLPPKSILDATRELDLERAQQHSTSTIDKISRMVLSPSFIAMIVAYLLLFSSIIYASISSIQMLPNACNVKCLPWFTTVISTVLLVCIPIDMIMYRMCYKTAVDFDFVMTRSVMLSVLFVVCELAWVAQLGCAYKVPAFACMAVLNLIPTVLATVTLAARGVSWIREKRIGNSTKI